MKVGDRLELEVLRMAHRGDGVARAEDGRVVFVPGALPGERVRAELSEVRKDFLRAQVVELVEASERRVDPGCAHYGSCPGCHLQHAEYALQLELKRQAVVDTLARIGKEPEAEAKVEACRPSPEQWRWRNRIELHWRRGELGYRRAGKGAGVVPIEACPIARKEISEAIPKLREWLERSGARPEAVEIAAGDDGAVAVVFEGGKVGEAQARHLEGVATVAVRGARRGRHGGSARVLRGPATLLRGGREVSLDAFSQPNDAGVAMLYGLACELGEAKGARGVLDAYAGTGTIAEALLEAGAQDVWAVEVNAASAASAKVRIGERVRVVQAELETAKLGLKSPELVVLDPPRSGCSEAALHRVVMLRPKRLVYVSCDPATFARDVGRLRGSGFGLERVVPVDMFPQTFHVELVARLTARGLS